MENEKVIYAASFQEVLLDTMVGDPSARLFEQNNFL